MYDSLRYLTLFLYHQVLHFNLECGHNYNRPDFINIQQATFKKFLKDDYEYVVFNDATDQNLAQQYSDPCKLDSSN